MTRDDRNVCPICGSSRKRDTGECALCGVYVCATCKKMHYGISEDGCPGALFGVDVPKKEKRR